MFLVVNADSWASLAVANEFISLRRIPPSNVLYLPWDGGFELMSAEGFRRRILLPVFAALQQRALTEQIDYLVYSSDFPTRVDFTADFKEKKIPPLHAPICSLNSATYLWRLTMAKSLQLVALRNNQYQRSFDGRRVDPPSHGFRSRYGWGANGELLETGGERYLLSTVLAVTSGRGNSLDEALGYLKSSAVADGTRPGGTIYFMSNGDVRSTVRAQGGGFGRAVEELKTLGVAATVLQGDLPIGKDDVQGAMLGVSDFSWAKSQSTIRPGAVCDNLTSFGGLLIEGAGQTPLTELLRRGAAGASGTVVEPMAVAEKFPQPSIHVHYARGCTLAEAFYQSTFGPFQLLIVGDPLCRPWARIPQVRVEGIKPGGGASKTLRLRPSAENPGGEPVDRFELFVNGTRVATCAAGEELVLDTTKIPDGYHELTVAGIESGPIESQGRTFIPVMVDNRRRTLTLVQKPAREKVRFDQPLVFAVEAPGMDAVALLHNGRAVGKLAGAKGEIRVDPRALGLGPVVLRATAATRKSPLDRVNSRPVRLVVIPPPPLPGLAKVEEKDLVAGLRLTRQDGSTLTIGETRSKDWLSAAGVQPGERFELQGLFQVARGQAWQFQLWHHGELSLRVDDSLLYEEKKGNYALRQIPMNLASGWHDVRIVGRAGERAQLRVMHGGSGTASVGREAFRHRP